MSESEKFHLQLDVDQEYKKFCFELIQRETEGEKIDYEKESIKDGFVNIVSFPGGIPIVFGDFEEKGKFGHELYTYGDLVINPRARTYKVKNINICKYLFNNLPINHKKALRRWKTYFDRAYCDYKLLAPTRYNDNIG
ncbi:hypothetical protein LCGC14_1230100, partial [marine sediment metagenome]